jgi:outer membrane protein assembly factor BamB
VFVATATSVRALDAQTGAARWSTAIASPLSAPLAWQNGWLLAGTENADALMLRASSGERLWERHLPGKIRAAAAMTGDRLYLPLESRHVLAVALGTGETIWEQRLSGRPTALAPLDDRLFAGADDKFFYCLSWETGKVDWRWRTGGPIVGTPAIDEDHVYFLSLDNVLRALNRGNGTQAWYAPVPFRPSGGPVLNARLLLVSGLTEVRAFQVTDGSDAGSIEVPEVLAAPPHFLAAGDALVSSFVVVTREGQARLLVPEPPPLPSKALVVPVEPKM